MGKEALGEGPSPPWETLKAAPQEQVGSLALGAAVPLAKGEGRAFEVSGQRFRRRGRSKLPG